MLTVNCCREQEYMQLIQHDPIKTGFNANRYFCDVFYYDCFGILKTQIGEVVKLLKHRIHSNDPPSVLWIVNAAPLDCTKVKHALYNIQEPNPSKIGPPPPLNFPYRLVEVSWLSMQRKLAKPPTTQTSFGASCQKNHDPTPFLFHKHGFLYARCIKTCLK